MSLYLFTFHGYKPRVNFVVFCLMEIGAVFFLFAFMNDANSAHFEGVFMNKFIILPKTLSYGNKHQFFNELTRSPISYFIFHLFPGGCPSKQHQYTA